MNKGVALTAAIASCNEGLGFLLEDAPNSLFILTVMVLGYVIYEWLMVVTRQSVQRAVIVSIWNTPRLFHVPPSRKRSTDVLSGHWLSR